MYLPVQHGRTGLINRYNSLDTKIIGNAAISIRYRT